MPTGVNLSAAEIPNVTVIRAASLSGDGEAERECRSGVDAVLDMPDDRPFVAPTDDADADADAIDACESDVGVADDSGGRRSYFSKKSGVEDSASLSTGDCWSWISGARGSRCVASWRSRMAL